MDYNKNEKCFLCGSTLFNLIHKGVRGASDINVVKCRSCGLVQLDKFIPDLNKFYEESNMRPEPKSIEEIRRTAYKDDYRRFLFTRDMIENKCILDFGAGGGGYIYMAKTVAKYACAIELEKTMQTAIEEDGIDCFSSIAEASAQNRKFDVITLFHVLEHLQNPIEILKSLSELLSDKGKIIIEVPNADDALLTTFRSEPFANFSYWMCHLYLYTNKTLSDLIKKSGLKLCFIQQIQRYPLANHLYWLVNGKPGGHKEWAIMTNASLDEKYGEKLAMLGIADTIIVVVEKL